MNHNRLICLVFTALALSCGLEAATAEPKQFPPGSLSPYFISMARPNYPEMARRFHRTGKGWYELSFDAVGGVKQVRVLKSSGVKILDDSVAAALLRWRAKPGMIQHAVIPVTFEMESPTHTHMMP